jgi:hypothetical protein
MFRDKFPEATDEQFEIAVEMVNAAFSGVATMWSLCSIPEDIREAKRKLLWNYLFAWQLATQYPDLAVGVGGTGSIPLAYKKAGPISIGYNTNMLRQTANGLDMLLNNSFGLLALQMIQSAPEAYRIYP